MIREIFHRRELKYLIPRETYERLVVAMSPYVTADPFGDGSGKYKISSLYFDSPDHRIYYETSNKLPIRQKLRLRTYNASGISENAFFEIKQKVNNWVHKRRTVMTLAEAYRYVEACRDGVPVPDAFRGSNGQVMREIAYFQQSYTLFPRVIVEYERHAFDARDGSDLRVTFDYNLQARSGSLLLESDDPSDHFVDDNLIIMEVKASGAVPFWLARTLSEFRCLRRNVSKYCSSVNTASPIDGKKAVPVAVPVG